MLHETLKQATLPNHNELEQLMFVNEIMNGSLSLQQYTEILITNYIVHNLYEEDLFDKLSPQMAGKLQTEKRKKTNALLADLQELQITPPVAKKEDTTFKKSDAEILGALYVLEGATLGGSVIVKRLKTNPNLSNLNLNFHYYQIYGSELINNWKSFCEILNQQPEETFEATVAGAKKMFQIIADVQHEESKAN